MKIHRKHKFQSVWQYTPLGDLSVRMREVCSCGKHMCRRGRTISLANSARKRNRKDVLANYNKTRINIGHQCNMTVEWNLRKRWEFKLILKWSYGSWIYNYQCNQCLSPLMLWVRISIRARCTTICDKVCQWLATGRWFSPGPSVCSTNKTYHHDIAEIKVALNTIKQTNKNI